MNAKKQRMTIHVSVGGIRISLRFWIPKFIRGGKELPETQAKRIK